jgi:hypothetical protein
VKVGGRGEFLEAYGGGGGSRTRVRKCYWSRDYMLIRVHALGITKDGRRPAQNARKSTFPTYERRRLRTRTGLATEARRRADLRSD